MQAIVLASTSRWRLQLLKDAGIDAIAEPPAVDETLIVGSTPTETARMRAIAKAEAVLARCGDSLVIGADQVIHLDGVTIGKPTDAEDWLNRLRSMKGRVHQLTTAVAMLDSHGLDAFDVHTGVRFRSDLTDDELRDYIAIGEAKGCAGGYMVERRGAWLVESIEGDWLNVVGLPVLELVTRLRARGWRVPV